MAFTHTIYNALFRRNTTMLATVFASAFALQFAFDSGSTVLWNAVNRGRQWQDIKPAVLARLDSGEDDEE